MGKGGRQCQMRGAEALGSENRGAQRGWEAGSPPATLSACVCVCTCVCVQGGGGAEERRGLQSRPEGSCAEMELQLLDGHGVIGWLRAGLDMPVRNLHAAPHPSSTQPSQLLWDVAPKPGLGSPGQQGFLPWSRFFLHSQLGLGLQRLGPISPLSAS